MDDRLAKALFAIAAALDGGNYPAGHDDILMSSNLSGLSADKLTLLVVALRGMIRVKDTRFAHEVARNAAALTHYAQMAEQARVLAEKGDGAALVAMFAPDESDTIGGAMWTDSDGAIVEEWYGVNGKIATRVDGVVQ